MIDLSKINMKDHMILGWSLERLKYVKEINNSLCEEMERLFNHETIKYILEECDSNLKRDLLLNLPAEKFADYMDFILERWMTMDDSVMPAASELIACLNKEKAFSLFSSYIEKESDLYANGHKLSGIFSGLTFLDKSGSEKLSEILIDTYIKSSLPVYEKLSFFPGIIKIAWTYEYPDFYALLKDFFLIPPEEVDRDHFLNLISALIVSSCEDFELISDYINECSEQKYEDLAMIFKDNSPLKEIDLSIEELKHDNYEKVISFLREHIIKIDNEKVRNLLVKLLNDEEITGKLDEDIEKNLFYSFILGCFVTSMRVKEINPDDLSFENIATFIMSDMDLDELPYADLIADFLKKEDRHRVVELLKDNMNNAEYGEINLISLMGRLLYEEFLPILVKEVSSGSHVAMEALMKYKDKALPFIDAEIKDMGKDGQYLALSIIETFEEKIVVDFINEHFLLLWPCNKEKLLDIIKVYPDEKFIEKLLPYIDKGQSSIDYTCLVLNKIHNNKNSQIDLLEKKYYEDLEEKRKYTEAFFDGRIEEVIKPYLDVELRCENCSDESFYRVKHIRVELCCHEEPVPYIEDEITCLNCNQVSSFGVTDNGKMSIMLTVFGINRCNTEEEVTRVMEKSPIRFVEHDHGEDDLSLEELEDMFLEEIETDPSDIYNYISLGNIYVDNERFDDAEMFLRKAMEIDPEYVEVYYILAYIFAKHRDDYKKALELLEKGKKYMGRAKYTDDIQDYKDEFEKNYRNFYNDMLIAQAHEGLSYEKTSEEKTGRNDPCPCGSGKKYKKCCMR